MKFLAVFCLLLVNLFVIIIEIIVILVCTMEDIMFIEEELKFFRPYFGNYL